jgi:hypothetical protein
MKRSMTRFETLNSMYGNNVQMQEFSQITETSNEETDLTDPEMKRTEAYLNAITITFYEEQLQEFEIYEN